MLRKAGPKYSYFDHTADVGIEIRGADEGELLANGSAAILDLVFDDPGKVEDREARPIRVEGIDFEDVLVNWLREVLFWAQSESFAPAEARVHRVSATEAEGELRGERFDPVRHVRREELKGVTRHDLRVEKTDEGLRARVVVDV